MPIPSQGHGRRGGRLEHFPIEARPADCQIIDDTLPRGNGDESFWRRRPYATGLEDGQRERGRAALEFDAQQTQLGGHTVEGGVVRHDGDRGAVVVGDNGLEGQRGGARQLHRYMEVADGTGDEARDGARDGTAGQSD